MKKGIYVIVSIALLLILLFYYKRNFVHNSNKTKYLTIWKTLGGDCYIIEGKYYSLLPPKEKAIKTHNTAVLQIAWKPNFQYSSIALTVDKQAEPINLSKQIMFIEEYNNFINLFYKQKFDSSTYSFKKNDSLLYFKQKYEVQRIDIGNF